MAQLCHQRISQSAELSHMSHLGSLRMLTQVIALAVLVLVRHATPSYV